jgi:CSLREA domain-containing protein
VDEPARHVRAAIALIALVLALPIRGAAASFVVNANGDAVDANPGDGSCSTAGAVCTLRAAVQEANALGGADTITVPAGTYDLTLTGANEDAAVTGDLDITSPMTITGAGVPSTIIDGQHADRIFDIFDSAGNVTIEGLTVRNGFSGVGTLAGGIWNAATLTLADVRIESSEGRLGGGGILNDGDMTATDVTLAGNTTNSRGAGLYNTGIARLERATLSGNQASAAGGGIENDGTLTLVNVTLSGNTAGTDGGGLYGAATSSLRNVTVAANTAGRGGGVFLPGETELVNTIVADALAGGDCGDAMGIVTSLGSNLAGDATCGFAGQGDLNGVAAGLAPLGDNGGATRTHALLPGSPAIDGGRDCPPPATDQRGMSRPVDGDGDQVAVCDVGAVEIDSTTSTTTPSSTTSTTLPATDVPLAGARLVLKDNAANAKKRKLLVVVRDPAAGVPADGDAPTGVGGTLRVASLSGGFDATYALPAGGWQAIGRPTRLRGYRYRDPSLARGPIAAVVIRNGKLLKVTGRGRDLAHTLATDPDPVSIVLTIGTRRQCARFGGANPKFVAGKRFVGSAAAAPSGCEVVAE